MPQRKTTAAAAKSPESDVEALKEEIETLKEDLKRLTQTLAEVGERKLESAAKEAASEAYERIPPETRERLEALAAQGTEVLEEIKKRQKEHPLGTLLIAAGIGFLLGKAFGSGK